MLFRSHWTASFKALPDHPIARGVKPFTINDEWYYHMRFLENGVTPILTAIPPASTLKRKDGPHSGNKHVRARKGMAEHVAWAVQRPDGGRGFGFTGGHYQWNWGHDDFRKLVLNAIVWTAKGDIPAGGVYSKSLTVEELEAIHRCKTGRLFRASLRMGAHIGRADACTFESIDLFGKHVGLAFQIADDLLDVCGDAVRMGKETQKDADHGKVTFPSLVGEARSRNRARDLIGKAQQSVAGLGKRGQRLDQLAEFVLKRDH